MHLILTLNEQHTNGKIWLQLRTQLILLSMQKMSCYQFYVATTSLYRISDCVCRQVMLWMQRNPAAAVQGCTVDILNYRYHPGQRSYQLPSPGLLGYMRKISTRLSWQQEIQLTQLCVASLHVQQSRTHPGGCSIPVKGLTIYLPMDTMAALVLTVNTNIDLSPWAGIL